MELWIRSQDRKAIVKPINILLENSLDSGMTGIRGYFSNNSYKMLGFYKTEQKALEVLDEIESFLVLGDDEFDKYGICNKYYNLVASKERMIYEMPEE